MKHKTSINLWWATFPLSFPDFIVAKIIPYSNIANKIGVWVPMNQLSRELNPLCEGAFIELYELINNNRGEIRTPPYFDDILVKLNF